MQKSASEHFKNIYGRCFEPILCIDGDLNIVFAADTTYAYFSVVKSAELGLCCILSTRQISKLKKITEEKQCQSFDLKSITTGHTLRCTVTPVLFNKDYYYTLMFRDISPVALDRLKKHDLSVWLDTAAREFSTHTKSIIKKSVLLGEDGEGITKNALKLERLYRTLLHLIGDDTPPDTEHVVDINAYIVRITHIIKGHLGCNRIDFKLALYRKPLLCDITYAELDVIILNTVASICRRSNVGSTVYVVTSCTESGNMMVFSDTYTVPDRLENGDTADMDKSAINEAVIKKLTRARGGEARCIANTEGGVSTAIFLPQSKVVGADLAQPVADDVQSFESLMRIILCDDDI